MKRIRLFLLAAIAAWAGSAAFGQPAATPGRFLSGAPGGQMLAFNLDASNGYNLAPFDFFATCSPTPASLASHPSAAEDGRITFSSQRDGTGHRVFVMNGDGTNVQQITFADATGAEDLFPAISPDGTKIAFVSRRTVYNGNQFQEVFVVNSDGTGLRQVTPVAVNANGDSGDGALSVAWSADSTRLAFRGPRYDDICNPSAGAQFYDMVSTINLDGTGESHLACVNAPHSSSSSALDWSPDGTLLAFGRSTELGDPAIGIIDFTGAGRFAAGLTLAQLGTACGGPHCIHFSPDSTELAYQNVAPSDNPSFNGFSIINLDGTGRSDSANLNASIDNFWWAPGAAIPAAAQLTLAPDPVQVWPGHSQQLLPSLLDGSNNVITHAAQGYCVMPPICESIDPAGLVSFVNTNTSTLNVINAGLTSNTVTVQCLASSPCEFSINPSSQSFTAAGGSNTVDVTTANGCDWSASSNATWITITSGSSGSGNGTVDYLVAANTGPARSGTMTVAGETFTVDEATGCQADASSQVTVKPQKIHFDRKSQLYVQSVMLSNKGGAALSNVVLVIGNLSAGVTLTNASGTTSCTSTGDPFVAVPGTLGKSPMSVMLTFSDPSGAPISYNTRVLAGSGTP